MNGPGQVKYVFSSIQLNKLIIKGQNIIKNWGFEAGDSNSFFSIDPVGFKSKHIIEKSRKRNNELEQEILVKMSNGEWKLKTKETVTNNKIRRTQEIICIKPSEFQDIVTRYRFKKKYFSKASINGKTITHKNSNKYYQYGVSEAKLIGKEFQVIIKTENAKFPNNSFKPNIYVRDYRDEWVIHVRLMPFQWDKEIIKWNVPWYNKAIPQWISNKILKVKWLKNILWLRGERKPYRFPFSILAFNVFPIRFLNKDERVKVTSSCEVKKI